MTAKGKINASNVQVNDRIIIQENDGVTRTDTIRPSDTKTGEGVRVARVIGKTFTNAENYGRRTQRWYRVETTDGWFEAAPIQTMWLAPEDAAGIKRAHVEALAEDRERELAAEETEEFTAEEREELAEEFKTSGALDEAHQEALTLHSQAGKVDGMDNASDTETTPAEPTTLDASSELAQSLVQADHEEALAVEGHTGSTVVRLLEKVWSRIRADHPELPEVVIITGSGLMGASKWGHFRAEGWKLREEGAAVRKHELFLAGEALAKGARQVLQTMLHEAAHTLAKVRGQQDTSRQGRWHNATFRKAAEEMGLEHKGATGDRTHGFSFVTLTTDTADRYSDLLTELDAEIKLVCHLPLWLGGEADQDKGGEKITGKPQGEGSTKSGPTKATCLCDEPLIIRLSQKVMDMAVVRCDECRALFLDRS